ncbi:hypothetical protein [Alteromonas gilva]|uniref:Uncharacterized protein n=1 Tax=Alteromonas gilva TaxID=2987522 RepID=A0ABT5L5G2_9ALTE|nr:hypothetical protein [Alteromonas gilva]MDC8831097.1 hypothetical protein [Alteromonas gilva]
MIKSLTFKQGNIHIKTLIALCLIVSVVIGVRYFTATEINHTSHKPQPWCWRTDTSCQIPLSVGDISIIVDALPAVEEQVFVSITLPAGLVISSAYIEGQNMYMGKIPLLLKQSSAQQWQGWFMLGSCSEPTMQWRLTLKLKDRPEPVWIFFSTSQV